jgi:ABC-2 type transport system permease protein
VRLRALSLAVTRAYVRDKVTLFFTFAFPLIFLVVFGLTFGGQSVGGGLRVIDYTAPGVMAWAVGNAALFGVAYTLMQWRGSDLLRLIRLTPTPLSVVLASRFLPAIVIALVQAVFFLGIAALPLFGLHVAATTPLALPVLLAGVTAFFALGVIVGTHAGSSEAIAAIANCIMLPMAFLSGTFYPISESPKWMQDLSRALPLRYLIDGIAAQLSGRGTPGGALTATGELLAFAAVFCVLAARTFRWSGEA